MSDGERSARWPPDWPDITDPLVLAAIAAVPRHLFVPPEYREQAYADVPQPIGQGQTISQPYIVALMTQELHVTPFSRVLEIGTGSGYQAAVLSEITPAVWSVEVIPELAETARARLHDLGYPVRIRVGDGCLGWPEHSPYDAIITTAAAREVPPALVAQLGEGAQLVIPIENAQEEQRLWAITRSRGVIRRRYLAEVRFVPLVAYECHPGADDPATAGIRQQMRKLFDWRDW